MKVLHVIPSIAACYGGPSKVVIDTCRALRNAGIDAEIATTNADENGDTPLPEALPATVKDVPVYFFARQHRWRYKFSWPLTKWLKRNVRQYDLLHIHGLFSYSTAAAAFYSRKNRVPYIILPHGMLAPWPMRKNRLMKSLYFKAIEKRNLEHGVVHFTAEAELRMSAGCGGSQFVLPYVLDLKPKSNGFQSKSDSNRLRILFLSRIHPKKGIEILIEALSSLAQEGFDFELVLAGSGEQHYENKVRQMIHNAGLSGCTKFAGFVEGIAKSRLFETCDVFVLPSHQENFGIAVAEAMTFGMPVIISDNVDIHEEIASEGAGLVVSASAYELSAALRTLLDSAARRLEIGARAKEFVDRRFSINSITRETLRIYSDVVTGSRESTAWRY
jgi:glycosyltransferase involved in cell wall biosynthesis